MMFTCSDRPLFIGINDDSVTFSDDVDCLPPDAKNTDTQIIWHPAMEVMIARMYEATGRTVDRNYSQGFEDWLMYNENIVY